MQWVPIQHWTDLDSYLGRSVFSKTMTPHAYRHLLLWVLREPLFGHILKEIKVLIDILNLHFFYKPHQYVAYLLCSFLATISVWQVYKPLLSTLTEGSYFLFSLKNFILWVTAFASIPSPAPTPNQSTVKYLEHSLCAVSNNTIHRMNVVNVGGWGGRKWEDGTGNKKIQN